MSKCKCEVCKFSREIEKIKKEGDVKKLRNLIDKLHNYYISADEDATFYKMKADDFYKQLQKLKERSEG